MIRIYRESPKGDLGLEVERWEGVVREIGAEPIALREMGEAEKKVINSFVIVVVDSQGIPSTSSFLAL